MKNMILGFVLLASSAASANMNIVKAKDIAAIMKNKAVVQFLAAEDIGVLQSIEFAYSLRCMGGPRVYTMKLVDHSGPVMQNVSKTVSVGNCINNKSMKVSIVGEQYGQED
jgi:hypothetical protein